MAKFIMFMDKINPDNLELFKKQLINYYAFIIFVSFGGGEEHTLVQNFCFKSLGKKDIIFL